MTGSVDRFSLGNNVPDDVTDIIYNVDPEATPYMSMIGRETSESDFIEWFRDSYAAADRGNAFSDGQDFVTPTFVAPGDAGNSAQYRMPQRLGVYHQISRKHWKITGRADKVNKYGRASEKDYQEMKRGVELRRDMEEILVDTLQGTRAGATIAASGPTVSTPPLTASLDSWLLTNVVNTGTGGSKAALSTNSDGTGIPTGVQTAGTAGALGEIDILSLMTTIYLRSDRQPKVLMLNPTVKRSLSNYLMSNSSARIATQYQEQGRNPNRQGGITVTGAVDVYITDFGPVEFMPNRRMQTRGREAFLLDTEMFAISFLRGFRTMKLDVNGDSEKYMTLVDWAHKCKTDESSGVITNIDITAAVVA